MFTQGEGNIVTNKHEAQRKCLIIEFFLIAHKTRCCEFSNPMVFLFPIFEKGSSVQVENMPSVQKCSFYSNSAS